MFYIVGLGNPGEKYAHQRHNIGWMMLDQMVSGFGLPEPIMSVQYSGRISEGVVFGSEVALLYPETFMNNSGTAVRKLVPKGEEERVILIYDDVDIPLGEVKISVGRGDGGHNGVKSVIAKLGTKEFVRVRVGIAGKSFFGSTKRPSGARMPKHVLGDFKKRELEQVHKVAHTVEGIVTTIVTDGVTKAMNKYN